MTVVGLRAPVALDVLLLLDATGLMGGVDQLKATIDEVALRVDPFETSRSARFAFTLYGDKGDTFGTKTYDFTERRQRVP